MKHFLSLAFLFACVFGNAQSVYQYVPLMDGGTNGVVANATRTVNAAIDVRKQRTLPMLVSFKCSGATSGNLYLVLQRSIDGVNYDTNNQVTWTVVMNGTSTVNCGTNYTCNGFGYYLLTTIQNTNASVGITNITLGYAVKQAD